MSTTHNPEVEYSIHCPHCNSLWDRTVKRNKSYTDEERQCAACNRSFTAADSVVIPVARAGEYVASPPKDLMSVANSEEREVAEVVETMRLQLSEADRHFVRPDKRRLVSVSLPYGHIEAVVAHLSPPVRETLPDLKRWEQVANHAMRTLLREDESLMYGHGGPRCKTAEDLYAAMFPALPPETGS